MADDIKKYFKIWWIMGLYASQVALQSRFGAILFVLGKFLRFFLFALFILILASRVEKIAGYSLWQMILFFATFNLIDILTQLFLREVYRFRSYVVSGDFDYFLVKPISPLFRSLLGGSDILDIPIFLTSVILIIISVFNLSGIDLTGIIMYLILIANAFIIALSFHIIVLAIGVVTTEVDNTLWLYRDLTQMARIPVDVYTQPIRSLITFIVPVGVMITFPAKALMGLLSIFGIIISFFIASVFLIVSLWLWNYSLKNYTSASS